MNITKKSIEIHICSFLAQLASDWEYDGTISSDSLMFSELGLQSLDAVILGNSLQEHYGKVIPYADLFANIGQREFKDVSVGEWIDFTYQHLQNDSPGVVL